MRLLKALTTLALAALVTAVPPIVNYQGVRVVRIGVLDQSEVDRVAAIIKKYDLSSWTSVLRPYSHIDLEIPPSVRSEVEKELDGFPIDVMHEDLGKSIELESAPAPVEVGIDSDEASAYVGLANQAWFNAYHSYADHLQWLRDVVATFPSNSRIVTSGTSGAGNTITGIHIYGSGGPGTKPALIFHGTVHAREWITTMVAEYVGYTLLNNYANSTEIRGFVDKYDYYIFPVVNPDGFIYTQTTQRLWRKNRQSRSGTTCIGTDINRNWNSQWAVPGGASTSPCSETYKGAAPSDSPENRGLTAFLNNIQSTVGIKLYMDWHSYSQLVMSPFGYSCSALPTGIAEFRTLMSGYAAAVRASSGLTYQTGPICPTIYQVTGGSVDYAYDIGADYPFTVELRDTGSNGFVLPPAQIRPTAVENWAGVRYWLLNIR